MRLLTYNIHKGIGGRDRLYRIERIIRVIEEQNPDVICLQEVDRNVRRSRHHDQPALLAEYFHLPESLYQLNVHLKTGGYGNLILSRWPFRERHQISLRQKTRKPRGAQLAVVDSPEGPFHLINCHLGLSAAERQWQVSRLLHHHLFRKHADLPTLLAGDFNDWRNVLYRDLLRPAGFQLVTQPISRFRSFPAWMSLGALDKVFVRGAIVVTHARVIRNALTRRASDHLPVVVDFHLDTSVVTRIAGPPHASGQTRANGGDSRAHRDA